MRIARSLINQLLKLDLQTRLVVGFLIAIFLTGSFATIMGIWTINRVTIAEIQNRVHQDINTAKLIYNHHLEKISSLLRLSSERPDVRDAIKNNNFHRLESLKNLIRGVPVAQTSGDYHFLDMLAVIDTDGKVLFRPANPGFKGDNVLWDPMVKKCVETGVPQVSTELMSIRRIVRDNPMLLERVLIDIVKTPKSFEQKEKQITEGMAMMAAYPILDENSKMLGVLVGGVLLNNDCFIVDKIKETIYRDEKYKGREMGEATIFQGGVRISTNVMTNDKKRAIGTTLSQEVYKHVFLEGKDWVGRAFVVNDWRITTYTPIYDSERKIVGILYAGLLEEKYIDIKWRMIFMSLGITAFGMIIATFISFRVLNRNIIITRTRIRILKEAAEAITSGNLDCKLSPDRISGFDKLDEAFNYMAKSLKDRDERMKKVREQLARSEKMTAVGEMAAGVAHEINNPLGGILLYSNLVLEDIPENSPARENMQKIVYQTNRCKSIVQNLLDFARATPDKMVPLQISNVITTSLNLVKGQSMFHGIEIETLFAEDLPDVIGDQSLLEEVFLNLFINAADAMKESGGKLTITTKLGSLNSINVIISDTGKGIEKENLTHIFEPFFTTKEPGQGTGLGLSIAYGAIKEHKGFIDADSIPGKGTTFTITLPLNTVKYDRSSMIEGAFTTG